MRRFASAFANACQVSPWSQCCTATGAISIAIFKAGQCANRFDPRYAPGSPRGQELRARRRRQARCPARSAQRAKAVPPRRASGRSVLQIREWLASVEAADQSLDTLSRAAFDTFQHRACLVAQDGRCLIVQMQRPVRKEERCSVSQFDQGLGTFLETRHCCSSCALFCSSRRSAMILPFSRYGSVATRVSNNSESSICRMCMPFSASSFWKSNRAAPLLTSPISNQRIMSSRRHHLVVAVAPAETGKIVAKRGRQVTHRPIRFDAERAVTF